MGKGRLEAPGSIVVTDHGGQTTGCVIGLTLHVGQVTAPQEDEGGIVAGGQAGARLTVDADGVATRNQRRDGFAAVVVGVTADGLTTGG
jgi:hypothetical protein